MLDKEILKIMAEANERFNTPQRRAHNIATVLAAPCKSVDGKLIFSRAIYRENYDRMYNIFLDKSVDNA